MRTVTSGSTGSTTGISLGWSDAAFAAEGRGDRPDGSAARSFRPFAVRRACFISR